MSQVGLYRTVVARSWGWLPGCLSGWLPALLQRTLRLLTTAWAMVPHGFLRHTRASVTVEGGGQANPCVPSPTEAIIPIPLRTPGMTWYSGTVSPRNAGRCQNRDLPPEKSLHENRPLFWEGGLLYVDLEVEEADRMNVEGCGLDRWILYEWVVHGNLTETCSVDAYSK